MPQIIEVPGYGDVEFPDGMDDAQIAAAIQQNMGVAAPEQPQQPAAESPSYFGLDATKARLRGVAQTTVVPAAQLMARGMEFVGNTALRASGLPENQYLKELPGRADAFAQELRDDAARRSSGGLDLAALEGQGIGSAAGGAVKTGLTAIRNAPAMFRSAAPMMERAVQGGVQGGMLSPTNDAGAGTNVGTGAAINAFLPPALRGAARVVSPGANSAAAQLAKEGVKLTPGQIIGGPVKAAEDAARSIPGLGDLIGHQQRQSFKSFNRVAIERALTPINEKLPKDLEGRAAVDYAQAKLGEAYESLLPRLKVDADPTFIKEVTALRGMATNLPPDQAALFDKVMRDEVLGKFTQYGKMSGETMKQVQTRLRQFVVDSRKSDNTYVRDMGNGLSELSKSLRELVKRSNPSEAGKLEKIDQGYGAFKRVQRAASAVTSQDGIFTPEQYHSAVKALDKSKDKSAFARGKAPQQDLSERARGVMGNRVPDSGTPKRAMIGLASAGGLGAISPNALVGAGLLAIPYLPGARAVTQAALLSRPPGANALAQGIRRSSALAPAALPASNALLYGGD